MKRWIATTEPKQLGEFRALQAKHLENWSIGAKSLEEAVGRGSVLGAMDVRK
jgi:hypothetical protein